MFNGIKVTLAICEYSKHVCPYIDTSLYYDLYCVKYIIKEYGSTESFFISFE